MSDIKQLEEELGQHIVKLYFKGKAPAEFDRSYNLLASGVLDSLTLMDLVLHIEKTYSIEFKDEIIPEHFESVNALARFIRNKLTTRSYSMAEYLQSIQHIFPQVNTYMIELGTVLAPYVMRRTPIRFRSEIVNTDDYGFRISYDAEGMVDSQSWWHRTPKALALGNSFLFGVGASCDQTAVVSQLNTYHRDYHFLNLAVLAGNSTQELIAALPFLAEAQYVLICSGGTNLFRNLQPVTHYDLYGAFEGEEAFVELEKIEFRNVQNLFNQANPEGLVNFKSLQKNQDLVSEIQNEAKISFTSEEIETRFNRAVALHRRDLRLVVRACEPSTPVLFALQPQAMIARPNLTVEEEELFAHYRRRDRGWRQIVEPYGFELWPRYTEALRQVCTELGVMFVDLNEVKFEGWCFVDHGHLNDNGQKQVAQYLAERVKLE